MVKVFVAHPQRLVCVALKDILEKFGDICPVGTSCDFAGAEEALASDEVEIFLTSDRLADLTGVSVLKKIKAEYPGVQVVFYRLGCGSALFDYMAARHGAAAVLPAECGYSELVDTVRRIAQGQLAPMQMRMTGRCRKLSRREMDVLAGILEGKTLGQTAQMLDINEKTVSTYKNRLFHKLGVKSTVELVGMYNYGEGAEALFQ